MKESSAMKSSRYAFLILAFFSFSDVVFGQQPSNGEDSRPRVAIEAGAQTRQTEGEKTFGFQMHRDIPQGAFLRTLDYIWLREGSPWRFSFHSTDLTQRDQRFAASLEKPFVHKLDFRWAGFTRYWSNHNPSILQEVSRGSFTAPAALRSSLENTTDNAALEALVRDAVGSSGQVEIRSFRERSTLTYAYSIVEGLSLKLSVMNERRRGNRLFAEGTYNRIGTPTGDTFETPGQEVFEPTHYQTNELGAELNYARRQWLVGFEYRASLFDNSDLALVWQNPFRLTHAQATPPAGALNRGRFAATQTALPPDNQAHTVSVNGLVLLPLASKVSGRMSWARWTQDEPFLPFTINTAITASNLGELSPTALEALPKASLEGLIHTLNQDYAATSRPARWLQLTARYNDYDLDNLTEEIHFPGFATYGDSFWRTSISGQPGTTPVPIQNEPKSFRRQRAELQTAVRPLDAWTWKSTYRYERYTREGRQVPRSEEHGLLTSISYAPNRVVFGQAGFR
jgi:MtrB/PioB family decaheme-associated outer membrane protein